MVSLKSFKPIAEIERDESDQANGVERAHKTLLTVQQVREKAGSGPSDGLHGGRAAHRQPNEHSPDLSDRRSTGTQDSSSISSNNNNNSIHANHQSHLGNPDGKINTVKMMSEEIQTSTEHERTGAFSTNGARQDLPSGTSNAVSMKSRQSVVQVLLTAPTDTIQQDATARQSTEVQSRNLRSTDTDSPISSASSSSSISIVVVQHDNPPTVTPHGTMDDYPHAAPSSLGSDELEDHEADNSPISGSSGTGAPVAGGLSENGFYSAPQADPASNGAMLSNGVPLYQHAAAKPNQSSPESRDPSLSVAMGGDHFEIVWSNLSYKILPKWYKRFNVLDQIFSHFLPGQTIDSHSSATSTASSSAGMSDNQYQMPSSASTDGHLHGTKTKSALDPIEIFTNLNGTIKSGQMTAVLGPSGAGKTTLLNCLTGKLRSGVSGHINLIGANGKRLKMCTIPQKDHLLELLTVEENLWFASKIKNPEYGFDHVKNIERVIDLLGLKRCRSAKIAKISGGQHKRVSIAQELLSNPDILVLDEPTSGLDSLTCFKTISMLRDLVELSANNDFMKPMAIIVTIHQPQPKVFNLFHHVYILANGGRVIYEGSPTLSLETITSVTGLKPIDGSKPTSLTPGSVDPASFLIEIASEEYGLEPIQTLNDYQRQVFYETSTTLLNHHNARRINNLGGGQFHLRGSADTAKDNHGFSPDDEPTGKTRELSTLFIQNQARTKGIRESRKQETSSSGRSKISQESEYRKESKMKNRKKSTYSLESGVSSGMSNHSKDTSRASDTISTASLYMSDQLLYTREANHKGRFWSHTATLTHRTLLTIRRDPLLMTSRVLFHLMIPILMAHVYGKATGAANACPNYEPEIDITQIPALVEGKRIEYMLEELHMSIENVSMFFIIMYAFAAAVLALNALSFPLNMQVLLKETRNGWYSMSSYVLAKTLADLPLELTMPCLTMALVYPLTGQPSSYLQWRMLTICLIMTLCSLIAQTQALILGALVMNSVQTAVFVSQASQLPWVILAGFTIRIKRLSEPLKVISLTSFYRLGCEAITLARYGFGICPCDPQEITGEPVKLVGIPDQLRTVAQYWIESMESSKANETMRDSEELNDGALATTTLAPVSSSSKTDIFQHLANQLSYANSYGVNITSCDDVAPDRIRAINLSDNWLVARIWHLLIMLIVLKVFLYYAVKFAIGIRL